MQTILTDDEIEDAWCKYGDEMGGADQSDALRIGREIEAAVLAKLREQEPVAYGMPDTQLGRKHRLMMVRLDKGQDGCTLPLYAAPMPAVVQVPQADWAADAREWGSALNDAGWEFDEAYRRCMGEPTSAKLFNTCKTIIRDVILRYAEKVSAAAEAPNKEQR